MKAVILDAPAPIEQHPLRVGEFDDPSPGPGEIVIKVTACGVCRSNLHMIEGEWVATGVPAFTPIIPGHEVVGTVAALGAGVTQFARGDRVGVQPLWSTCGVCEYCLAGRDQLCQSKHITGETVNGGYAEYLLAKAAHAYPVPDAVGDAEAAPLFCPGITAYGAVAKAELTPAKTAAVFGVGGVGHMALQFARLHGAEVTAVTRGAARQRVAAELGADHVVDASRVDAGEELAKRGGVDAAIMCAPSNEVARQAIRATKPGGIVVVLATAEIGALPFVEEQRVVGSLLGTRRQMREVLDLAAAGKIRAVVESYPLEQAGEVLQRLKRGEVRARAVLLT